MRARVWTWSRSCCAATTSGYPLTHRSAEAVNRTYRATVGCRAGLILMADTFGEYLVQQRVLDRFQLFRVLQLQDRAPDARLGACAVALGFVKREEVERQHRQFARRPGALDTM